MLLRGTNRRTVFFFGAGASRGAIRHVWVGGKMVRPPLNGDFFEEAERFAAGWGGPAPRRLARLNDFLDRVHPRDPDHPRQARPTMESAFSLLYTAKDFHSIYRSGPGRRPASGSSQELKEFWWLMTQMLCEISRTERSGYDDLVRMLGASDTIATLNYDLACDAALVRAGWEPGRGYALGGDHRKVEWLPDAVSDMLTGVRLLKLHGSLNWWVRGSLAELDEIYKKKPKIVTGLRTNEYAGYLRQIAPPMYGKAFAHPHWENLWNLAYQALCEAEVLVVVGCGIIDTDFHLRAFLTSVCAERKSHPFHTAILVDFAKVRHRWERVLKGAVRRYETVQKFEGFLRRYGRG